MVGIPEKWCKIVCGKIILVSSKLVACEITCSCVDGCRCQDRIDARFRFLEDTEMKTLRLTKSQQVLALRNSIIVTCDANNHNIETIAAALSIKPRVVVRVLREYEDER